MLPQKSIKDILTVLLKQHDLNESELSRYAHVSQPTVHRLLSGKTPDPRVSTLKLIARYFDLTLGQLAGTEPLPLNETKPHAKHLIRLPLIPWELAYHWQTLTTDYAPGNWTYWTASQYLHSPQSFALVLPLDHASAPFTKDTVLVIDPSINPSNDHHVLVHRLSDQSITIKKLFLEGSDPWLMPLNEQIGACRYDHDHRICGVIVQANMPFRVGAAE